MDLAKIIFKPLTVIFCVIIALFIATFLVDKWLAAPVYTGALSHHFDGKHFKNTIENNHDLKSALTFFYKSRQLKKAWPQHVENALQPKIVERSKKLRITFINHSTFLIQIDNINILTDPIFSLRASPFFWLGPKRVRKPALRLDQLPFIDVILISHNHYDHLDIKTLQKISAQQKDKTPPIILAGLGNGEFFQKNTLSRYIDLDWNQSAQLKNVEIFFTESKHRSGRAISDQMKTLWGAFVIQSSQGLIYFAGDTGYSSHFKDTQKMYGDFKIALLPIGAYEPRDFMQAVHLNPEDAVKAHIDLHAQQSIAMHIATFQLTYEAIDQPFMDLQRAKRKYQVADKYFRVLEFGESIIVE